MNTLILLVALGGMQDEDPAEKARAAVQAVIATGTRDGSFGLATVGKALEELLIHASQQTAAGRHDEGAAVLEAGLGCVSDAIKGLKDRPAEHRRVLVLIEKARRRASEAVDGARKVAAMRYGIERAQLAWQDESGSVAGLFNLGLQELLKGNLEEAEDALTEAGERLPALRGIEIEDGPKGARWAPVLLARVRMFQGRHKAGAEALRRGVSEAPDFFLQDVRYADLHQEDDGRYAAALKKLEQYCELNGDDADAVLLLAHERFFSADRASARPLLEKVLRGKPGDPAAKAMLEMIEDP